MEASETPLFNPTPDAPGEGSVRVLDDRLVIERLTIEDERAARVVRQRAEAGHPAPRTVADAVEIGARVLEREGTAAEVDYVRAEFERTQGEMRERLAERDRALTEGLKKELGALPGEVRQRIEAMLKESRDVQLGEVLKELGSRQDRMVGALRESNERQQQAMQQRVAELTEELTRRYEQEDGDRRVAEAEEAGTRKGRTFEDRVHEAVERIARARGDAARDVSDEPGVAGSKKGDTLVEVGAADAQAIGRFVVEAKDKQESGPKAWEALNGALKARDAGFAVLVVEGEEAIPPGREEFSEYEGNKLIVAVDAEEPGGIGLRLAYNYARCRVLLAEDADLAMDAARVRDAAAEMREILDGARNIRGALTKADKGISDARVRFDSMLDEIVARLERIESLVSGPAEPPGSAA
jgi:hypothetical protein